MADDSAAVRRLMSTAFEQDPDIEITAAAKDGKEAVEMVGRLKPDVVLLDVEMPVMDGIDALRCIRKSDKDVPVLMFSSLTVKGAEATLDALSVGTNDYVSKPAGAESVQHAIRYINSELGPKMKMWGRRSKQRSGSLNLWKTTPVVTAPPRKTSAGVDAIVIGSSTGGPNALAAVIKHLPQNLSVPVLIVQHMPVVFTKLLAEKLNDISPLNIREATGGEEIRPGDVFVAPGDQHMAVSGTQLGPKRIVLNSAPPENSCRPAVDVLFRSAATVYRDRTLAVVLTGMGTDGTIGARAISNAGGYVIAQDCESSTVWGMPRAVAEAGLANSVVSLDGMYKEILRHVYADQQSRIPSAHGGAAVAIAASTGGVRC